MAENGKLYVTPQTQPLVIDDDFLQVKEKDYELVLAKRNVKDKMVRNSIASIRDWYDRQGHLPKGAISNERIFRLLFATDFSTEKTKQRIDNLLTARALWPEILTNRDPSSERMATVKQFLQFAIIPRRLDDMTRLVIWGFKGDDLSNYNVLDNLKLSFMAIEYLVSSDICLGDHYIVDWKGFKLAHVTHTTPALIKKIIFILHNCYRAKVKCIHYTNVPSYAEIIVLLLKATFSEKIGSRLHLHKSYEHLSNFFPKSHLPSDFGGENKSMEDLTEDMYEQLVKHREWFLKQDQYKANERKRVGVGSAVSRELQGLQGSFRMLNID